MKGTRISTPIAILGIVALKMLEFASFANAAFDLIKDGKVMPMIYAAALFTLTTYGFIYLIFNIYCNILEKYENDMLDDIFINAKNQQQDERPE